MHKAAIDLLRDSLLFVSLFLSQFALAAENELPAQGTEQQNSDSAVQEIEVQDDQELEQKIVDDGSDLLAAEITETNKAEEETSGRFIPTEEISQDLGVSFPVDI